MDVLIITTWSLRTDMTVLKPIPKTKHSTEMLRRILENSSLRDYFLDEENGFLHVSDLMANDESVPILKGEVNSEFFIYVAPCIGEDYTESIVACHNYVSGIIDDAKADLNLQTSDNIYVFAHDRDLSPVNDSGIFSEKNRRGNLSNQKCKIFIFKHNGGQIHTWITQYIAYREDGQYKDLSDFPHKKIIEKFEN